MKGVQKFSFPTLFQNNREDFLKALPFHYFLKCCADVKFESAELLVAYNFPVKTGVIF